MVAVIFILVFMGVAASDTLFYEDFETARPLDIWYTPEKQKLTEWLVCTRDAAYSGVFGISIKAGTGKQSFLYQNVRWPIGSKRLEQGVYFSAWCRVHRPRTSSDRIKSGALTTLFLVDLVGKSGAYFSTPIIFFRQLDSMVFCLTMSQRSASSSEPEFMDACGPVQRISFGTWNRISLFLSLTDSVLVDTLFLNAKPIGTKHISFTDRPGLVQDWRIGADQDRFLPVAIVDFDNIAVTADAPEFPSLRPVVTRPCEFAYINAAAPTFFVEPAPGDSQIKWLEITIDSGGRTIMDSQFVVSGPYLFGRLLSDHSQYSFKARYIEKDGVQRPWTFPRWFFIGSLERAENTKSDNNRVRLLPGRRGTNVFSEGDTITLEFEYPLSPVHYIDVGVRSEKFSLPVKDRFGSFDSTRNFVFSLNSDGVVFSKYPIAGDEWIVAPGDSSGRRCRFGPGGRMVFSFPIRSSMVPGIWTINAALTTEQPAAVTGFPTLYFIIQPPARTTGNALIFAMGACCLLAGAAFYTWFVRRKHRNMQQIPPSWIALADEVEAFLQKNYANKDLTRVSISEQMHLEDRKLAEIFQRVKGKSPLQRLKDIRMEKACEFLQKSVVSIADVAYQVGFDDPHIFQRNFKKTFGVSPSQFRKQP